MSYTEQDALSEAQLALDTRFDFAGNIVWLAAKFKSLFERGREEGTKRDLKEMYWAGVIAGVERYAWWSGGKKYVGGLATPQTEFSAVIKQILRERQEALDQK